ncbi:RelA/SpoT family protein [Natranaerofaba carboxydovora]|uniref:RelA/SpoT family protein n=1 Tax=Natranaerofaba carboxydovora TaxID=2742683 RepID=UPI001F1394E6|nr:bifunctional (p)ppGpp synthetase/guanosine-3',5'-bis(diphosphate) 3'-pyrophosphohydrolase [Natranaerofaba carboxydovora]UMZ73243.1 GTP pyrophosphokinase [Natranaerofaba carboxydovora]
MTVKKYRRLRRKIKKNYTSDSGLELLDDAYEFAENAHSGQKRVSGIDYFYHPLEVAFILAELELDLPTVCAGLLHDVIEDTEVTKEEVEEKFGSEIALLVDGVTKLSKLEFKSKEERQAENLRKMFLAMAEDIRVILIKLADRTHNMRTLDHLPKRKQKKIAKETLEIYAPLAHRLGISMIKWELEDKAFRYLEPQQYFHLARQIAHKRQSREEYLKKIQGILKEKLDEMGIEAEIQGRPKHLYSIYTKMKRQEKDLDEIYDLTAVRIIVNNIKECYEVLGSLHNMWKPVPGRFKDYIAVPKPNMYQSLHTTLICPEGQLLEIQIRTWEMHKVAEYGIAAHWLYKDEQEGDQKFAEKLSWLRQLLEWQKDMKDAKEFMENLKIDFFSDEVFVFTPKGDVINLPLGSTPLDFAYRIHTEVGNSCIGAKVNERIVPLDYQLKNGDIVEVLTSKQASPSRDWLNIVKSSQARNKIRQWFKREKRDENIQKGKEMLEKELKRLNYTPSKVLKESYLEEIGTRYNFKSSEDLLAAVGYGGITVNYVIGRLEDIIEREEGEDQKEEKTEEKVIQDVLTEEKPRRKTRNSVSVEGLDNIVTRFAKCCCPLPGEEIVGFITRGRGISVHKKNCPNAKNRLSKNETTVPVYWDNEEEEGNFPVDIMAFSMDRPHLIRDIMDMLGSLKVPVTAIQGKSNSNGAVTVSLTVIVRNHSHLQLVIDKLSEVKNVYKVQRVVP